MKYSDRSPQALSIMRIVVAFLFMAHGSQKLFSFPAAMPFPVELFSQMGVAGILELFGGLFLLAGVFTRPIAFILSGEMAVAYFMVHASKGFFPLLNGGELAVLYCFAFLYFCVAGGGVWSVDDILFKRKRTKMRKLFVQKSILINAPASKVWEAITQKERTEQWAREFLRKSPYEPLEGPAFHIESDWQVGKPVLWKSDDGKVIVEGKVTALEPNKFLRFTVFDTSMEKPSVSEEDGITFELVEQNGVTMCQMKQGDFSVTPEGEKFRQQSEEIWNRVLPKIKEMAERA